jgi:hypothetical protein
MTFATRAEASTPGTEVPSSAVGGTQSVQPGSTGGTVVEPSTADPATSNGGSTTTQPSSTDTADSAAIAPQKSSPESPASGVENDATTSPQHAPGGTLEVPGAPPAATSAPVIGSPAPPPPAASGAFNPALAPSSTAATVEATVAAIMLERQRRAQGITTAWPAVSASEQPQATAPASELQSVISQFESLARDTPAAIAAPTGAAFALARTQEMRLISLILSASPLPTSAVGPRSTLDSAGLDASFTVAAAERSLPGVLPARSDRFGAARRTSPDAPARAAVLPTSGEPLSSLAGGALGGGATGLGAPAAALLVVAAACLLATRSQDRRNMDPLPWRSVLLSSRLERPG